MTKGRAAAMNGSRRVMASSSAHREITLPLNFAAALEKLGHTRAFQDARDAAYRQVRAGATPPFESILESIHIGDPTAKLAMACHIHPWVGLNSDWIRKNKRRQEAEAPAATRRNVRIANHARKGRSARWIAARFGVSKSRAATALNQLGFVHVDGAWIPPERLARAKVARHKADCRAMASFVDAAAVPSGTVGQATLTMLARGALPMWEKGEKRYVGRPVKGRGLFQLGRGCPSLMEALATLWAMPLTAAKVNGYPAFVWENGLFAFFHHTVWMMEHGLWAKPYDGAKTHIHHIDGDPCNSRPKNLVLLPATWHTALERTKARIRASIA